jgi:hypothetical protein
MRTQLSRSVLAVAAGCCLAAGAGLGSGSPPDSLSPGPSDACGRTPSTASAALHVQLPSREHPFPEPLPPGRSKPAFAFRGTKGWDWTPRQYLEEIHWLSKFKMNFLMNCYLSLFTQEAGEPPRNEWWKAMTDARRRDYAEIIRSCRGHGITFCFAVHPQLSSPRPLNPESREDVDRLYQHYAWAQSQGVRWFSVCLDDVGWGADGPAAGGAAHAGLANTIFGRLRDNDPGAQLILCPVPYWGDGSNAQDRAYLEALGGALHPDAYVFWTGDRVFAQRVTRRAAEAYRRTVRHRLFLWDNYPVNDGNPTLHLGPLRGREPDLCEVVDGYMSNPMRTQNEINRIPLATCADYAYNPWAYDPARSIGQAILHLADGEAQRQVLRDLVEAYPGFIATGGDSRTNPVRARFAALRAAPETRPAALDLVRRMEELDARLAKGFPDRFGAARETIGGDIGWMRRQLGPGR